MRKNGVSRMRLGVCGTLLMAAVAGPAAAQPSEDPLVGLPDDPPVEEAPAEPAEPAAPVVAPVAEVSAVPSDAPPAAPAAPASDPQRPEGTAVGIGTGYVLPANVLTPNTASVRFRLASGITFEPSVSLATRVDSTSVLGSDTSNKATGLAVGTDVRLPMASRGRFDLILVLGGAIAFNSSNPDGADNNSSTLTLSIDWGGGIDWWLTRYLSLSATATNPVVSLSRQSADIGGGEQSTQSSVTVGAIFTPQIDVMAHLYF